MFTSSWYQTAFFCTVSFWVLHLPLAPAMTLEDVAFNHTFEKGLTATLGRGHVEPVEVVGAPEVVAGRDGGKAVKLRNGLDAVGFALPDNLNPEHGALSFWLSSGGNWEGAMANLLQLLFHTDGDDPAQRMVLQTIWHHRGLALIGYNQGEIIGGFPQGTQETRAPLWMHHDAASTLQEGEWYHYLYTWREGHVVAYLNGVRAATFTHPGLRFRDLGDRFYLGWKREPDAVPGDMNFGKLFYDTGCAPKAMPDANTPWESLIADFTIFRTYIYEHQAARIYEHGAVEYARRAEPSPVEMSAAYYQSLEECVVEIVAVSSATTVGELRLENEAGDVVRRHPFRVSGDEISVTARVALTGLPVGVYSIHAHLDSSGFETPKHKIEKVSPDWLGNTLGAEDVVLHPWTPVEVTPLAGGHGHLVSVWGRDYEMRGALPTSILSQGDELLNAPVAFLIDGGQGNAEVDWSAPKVREHTDTRVVMVSRARSAGYDIEAVTRVEYDGMLWTELNFAANTGSEIHAMRVEVPMARNYCVFKQWSTLRDLWFPEEPMHASFALTPYLFVGNDDAGIQWFAESDQWWHLKDTGKALEISPTETGGVMRIHMVNDPVVMPDTFTIAFGLMATPVRPRPENWRGWGWRGFTAPENHNPQWLGYSQTSVAPGWLVARHVAPGHMLTGDRLPDMDNRAGTLPFSSTLFFGARHYQEPDLNHYFPEVRQFRDEWLSVPHVIRLGSKPGWNELHMNPTSSYIDFYCWMFEHMLANTEAGGLYVDGYAGNRRSANREAGFGYVDRDGTVKPTWPILAGRELYRRTSAILLRHRGPEGVYMIHHATTMIMPVLSFVNSIYDGEFTGWGDIGEAVRKHGLPAGHSEDRIRAILNMRPFGHVPYIDSRNLYRHIEADVDARFGGKRPEGYTASGRDMIARYLQSDVHAVRIPTADIARELRHVMDRWGIAQPGVAFLPYWSDTPAATINDGGRIGGYVNRKRGTVLLIVIGGRGGSPSRALDGSQGLNPCEIVLDLDQFGFVPNGFRVFNAESRREYPATDNQISLDRAPGELLFLQIDVVDPAERPVAALRRQPTAADLPTGPKSSPSPADVNWMGPGAANPTLPALHFTGASFKSGSEPDAFRGIAWGTPVEQVEGLTLLTTTEYGTAFYAKADEKRSFENAALNGIYYGFDQGCFQAALLRVDVPRGTEPQQRFDVLKKTVFDTFGEGCPRNTYAWGEEYLWQGDQAEVYLGRDAIHGKGWLLIQQRVR